MAKGEKTRGTADLRTVMDLCREGGNEVHVNVQGGPPAIDTLDLHTLRLMPIQWHLASDRTLAHSTDCVTGDVFRYHVRRRGTATGSLAQAGAAIGKNYFDQVGFHEIVAICERQGDAVIVGIHEGGARALRRMSQADIVVRLYKYDFAANPIPPKNLTNWVPGSKFLAALSDLGMLPDHQGA